MDEAKKEQVRKEAKKILDNFSKALDKVKAKKKEAKAEAGGYREEGEGVKGSEDFRERMFSNAPKKEGDYIIAEKKQW